MISTIARHASRISAWIEREPVLAILLLALILLQVAHPRTPAVLAQMVDWPTVVTLAGLLMLTQAIELSGALDWLARRILIHIHNERALALSLVWLAAALSMLLTNDVALFAAVPLVLTIDRIAPINVKRLVVCLALAVNSGSILTPFGNPQNLFLWQASGVSFVRFMVTMAPLCGVLLLFLSGLTAYLFAPRPLDLGDAVKAPRLERGLAGAALIGLLAFIVLVDAHHALSACAGLALVCAWVRREILYRIDWPLLGIFVLMFIVLRAVAALPLVAHALTVATLDRPLHGYLASAILSQGISNVPAAIVLAEFSRDWRALAFGVSVGGFGCVLGSLANLIALRLARRHGMWREFHILSVPFFGFALLAGALLLNCFAA